MKIVRGGNITCIHWGAVVLFQFNALKRQMSKEGIGRDDLKRKYLGSPQLARPWSAAVKVT